MCVGGIAEPPIGVGVGVGVSIAKCVFSLFRIGACLET